MKWWLLLLWAAVLLVLGTLVAGVYQAFLMRATMSVLGLDAGQPPGGAPDISAANALALYGALCLATAGASWAQRLRALALGLPQLVILEIVSGVIAVKLSQAGPGLYGQIGQALLDAQRWCAVPIVWFMVIGRRQLSAHRDASQKRRLHS